MPLGNGAISTNAWINPAGELEFYIGRTDTWDEYSRLLKVGKIRIVLDPPPPLDSFGQTLSLTDATMEVRFGKGKDSVALDLWVDANHPVIHATIDSPVPRTATASIELWRTTPTTLSGVDVSDVLCDRRKPGAQSAPTIVQPDTILAGLTGRVGWYHRNRFSIGPREHAELQDMAGFPREDPLLHRTFGALVTADAGVRIDDTHLRSPTGKRHRFSVFTDTLHPATGPEWLARMDGHVTKVSRIPFETRRKAHEAWWAERWNRSWIVASEDANESGTRIPANGHPLRVGTDQTGGSRLAADLGRISVIGRALEPSEIAALCRNPQDQAVAAAQGVRLSRVAPPAGPINGSAGWKFDSGLTVEAWVKPTRDGAGGGRIIDKITGGTGDGILFDTYGGLRLIFDRTTLRGACRLAAGQWTHVAAVVPPSPEPPRLYLNGQLLAEGTGDSPDDAQVVTRGYALQRYLTICAGRGTYPIKFNGSIFTVPAEGRPGDADYRQWGPGYWWQNTRLPYASLCASGDTDLMGPLFAQYIDRFLPLNLYRTKHYFGHGGACYIECVHHWGDVFNEVYGWTPATERADKLQTHKGHKWEWVCGPELVFMALDYHEHTGDTAFLRDKVLPLADAVLRFFAEHYQVDDRGKLVMHPSQALETWLDTTNPMPELAGITAVTRRLLALPDELTDAGRRAFWKDFQQKLPPLPTREIGGKTAFAPAERFDKRANMENPELYCVFPFRLASFNRDNADLAVNALEHRWSRVANGWSQADIFMAYLGLTDQARKAVVTRARTHDKNSRFPAFWGPNFDWTPDQDHGGVLMKAFQAMLMQAEPAAGDDHAGKIHLLPAWPRGWNVDFKLHAPGQTVLEGRYRRGKLENLTVIPPARRADVVIPTDIPVGDESKSLPPK